VRSQAARLEETRLAAVEQRIDHDLACGRHTELVGELAQLTTTSPLRERLWSARMLALYRSGRQADALSSYQDLRRLLHDELGLEPSRVQFSRGRPAFQRPGEWTLYAVDNPGPPLTPPTGSDKSPAPGA
jgi:DNA-binding SARP family transcriptional activator